MSLTNVQSSSALIFNTWFLLGPQERAALALRKPVDQGSITNTQGRGPLGFRCEFASAACFRCVCVCAVYRATCVYVYTFSSECTPDVVHSGLKVGFQV
jgi:hypothetical protein